MGSRDLPACSVMRQTLRYRVPPHVLILTQFQINVTHLTDTFVGGLLAYLYFVRSCAHCKHALRRNVPAKCRVSSEPQPEATMRYNDGYSGL
jgi:hypothetical protein